MERYMEVKNGRAQINIGKHGITPTFLEHLRIILKKERIVKIKILKDISMEQGNEPLINKIIEKLNVYVLDSRGNTFIISKRKITGIHLPKKYLLLKNTLHPPSKKKKKEIEIIEPEKIVKTNEISEPEYIDYDNEELVAEIGSILLGHEFNIEKTVRDNHSKYLNSWIKQLSDDDGFKLLHKASTLAQKGVEFMDELQNPQAQLDLETA